MRKNLSKFPTVILSMMLAMSAISGCQEKQYQNQTESSQNDFNTLDTVSEISVQNVDIPTQILLEAQNTDNQISMTVWCSQQESALMTELIQQFEETYKNDKYEFDIKTENVDVSQSERLLENPKDSTDILFFSSERLAEFSKVLLPISDDYYSKVRDENMEHAFTCAYDNEFLYGFPKTPLTQSLLFYDKRVFDTEDIGSLETMIQKSAEQNKNVLFDLENTFYCLNIFFSSGVRSAGFDSEQGLYAARTICQLVRQNGKGIKTYLDTESGDSGNEWANGKISAQIATLAEKENIVNAIGNDNIGVAKLPTILINDKEVAMHCLDGYTLAGVNAATKYPAAAQALAYYLTNEDAQLKAYEELGIIPTNENLVKQNDTIKKDPLMKAYRQQSPNTEMINEKYFSVGLSEFVKRIEEAEGELFNTELKARLAEIQNKIDF